LAGSSRSPEVSLYAGFDTGALELLRCPEDDAPLAAGSRQPPAGPRVWRGTLVCSSCRSSYPIEDGIADLTGSPSLDDEQSRERGRRDADARGPDAEWDDSPAALAEKEATIESLGELAGRRVLELGCGTGRFTTKLAAAASVVLAVDFSREALRVTAERLDGGAVAGLVHADCTRLRLAEAGFDVALATLVSNLPTPGLRAALFALCRRSLRPRGRLVLSTHHYGWRQRLARAPQSGRYAGSGIYRYLFTRSEIVDEVAAHFARVSCRPVGVRPPLLGRLPLPPVATCRAAERIPLLRQLGDLLLLTAESA
jgi:SAM-dependent methyltransferase